MKVQNIRQTNTESKIENAFLALIKKKDIEKITINTITKQAQINRATFYAHYEDKYDLFNKMTKTSIQQLFHSVSLSNSNSFLETLNHLSLPVYNYLRTIEQNCPYNYQQLFPKIRLEVIAALIALFEEKEFLQLEDPFVAKMYACTIYDAAEICIIENIAYNQQSIYDFFNSLSN